MPWLLEAWAAGEEGRAGLRGSLTGLKSSKYLSMGTASRMSFM